MEVVSSATGVRIRVQDRPLIEVLQEVANAAEIRFRVSQSLLGQKVTADIQAADWQAGLSKLLKNFSRVGVWKDGSKLAELVLLESHSPLPDIEEKSGKKSARSGKQAETKVAVPGREENVRKNREGLSEEQLRRLAGTPFRGSPPAKLFDDPRYREFLGKRGVESPRDLKDAQKAMAVRREALRQLRALRNRNLSDKKSPSNIGRMVTQGAIGS